MILRFQVFHLTSAAAFVVSFTFALTKTRAMNSFLLRHATPLLLFLALAASQDFTTGYCFWDCWREREACLHKKGQSHSDWDTLVRTFILTPPPKKKKISQTGLLLIPLSHGCNRTHMGVKNRLLHLTFAFTQAPHLLMKVLASIIFL